MSLPPPSPATTITFFAALQQLPDPRDPQDKRHDLAFVLCGVVLALMAGRTQVSGTHRFLHNRFKWLREITHAPVSQCLSRARHSRLLAQIDWAALATLSLAHFGVQVAVDGKALRGSPGEKIVLARTHQSGDILAHQPLAGPKASEIPAVRTLPAQPPLLGRKVTLDAGHCNPTTLAQIHQAQGGYLVQLKANQPTLHTAVTPSPPRSPRSAPSTGWTKAMSGLRSATPSSSPSPTSRSPYGSKTVACTVIRVEARPAAQNRQALAGGGPII
jgi:hypothetical protein